VQGGWQEEQVDRKIKRKKGMRRESQQRKKKGWGWVEVDESEMKFG
jgi:hypothetical protein